MVSRSYLVKTAAILAMVGVAACSTGPRAQTNWVNPGIGQESQQQRFTLDSMECAALANQVVPEPAPPPRAQSGTITLETPKGPVYGSYQGQPAGQPGDGFLVGMQRGQREQSRRNYAVACMGNRGWQQR